MVQPINYTLDVLNPVQSTLQGFTGGMQLGTAMADRERALAQQEQEQLAKQQMNEDLYNLSVNPTYEGYTQVMTKYPQLSENLKRAYDTMDVGKQQTTLSLASQTLAALHSNNPEIAKDVLENGAIAYDNSGNKQDAAVLRGYKKMIEANPDAAKTSIGMLLASTNPEKFADIYGKLGSESRANEMQPLEKQKLQAETGKIQAETQGQTIENIYKPQQIQTGINQTESQTALNYANIQNMADRVGLDRDKLLSEYEYKYAQLNPSNVKLSDGAQKLVNDTMLASVTSEQSANQQNNLADRIEAAGGGFGAFSRFSEWVKGQTGNQEAMTQLRNEYTRIRNSQAIKMLPPGPATDKDIEMALKGFPADTADSKSIASFLRGMAKMNQRDSAYQQMQAEWINQVGNLGSVKRDVNVLGVNVPSGTTFNEYANKNLNKAIKRQASQAVDRDIATGQRSYFSAVQ
ncbi:hypothetical protein [Acinetobacter venetianus]|uniref:hypothetical protein n=2 Tax=Pseudomonadota TaxID=1224 RepID=UPI00214FBCCA|nr:hypothetical protein [Acinetobacter venetianus]MCR4530039.1 hypothetical protein [Acinetobacter venetianus]